MNEPTIDERELVGMVIFRLRETANRIRSLANRSTSDELRSRFEVLSEELISLGLRLGARREPPVVGREAETDSSS